LTAAAALSKSDVEAQLDAAHKYPRNIKRFLSDAAGMVTMTRDVAASCMYALKREDRDGEKIIPGPSVRLAEIAASAYGNLHIAARVLDAEQAEIVAQGVCWDLEKNVRISIETRRRITRRGGARYSGDMIVVTGNAAASIALRNAIFRVIPGAYIQHLYNIAKRCAIGEGLTLPQQRDEAFATLLKMGIVEDRVLGKLGRGSLQDVKLGDVELLIGLTTAIREGGERADDVFPSLKGQKPGGPSLEDELKARERGQTGATATVRNDTPFPMSSQGQTAQPGETLEVPTTTTPGPDPKALVEASGRSAAEALRGQAPQEVAEAVRPAEGTVGRAWVHPGNRVGTESSCPLCDQLVGPEGIPMRTSSGSIALRHATCRPPAPEADPWKLNPPPEENER
jgi:hypothetical protein